MIRTCEQWKKKLPVSYCEALAALHKPNELLSTYEVLNSVVAYHGGVANGFEILRLVANIYDINLREVDTDV